MIGRLGVYPPVTSGRQEEASQAGHLVPVLNYKFPPSMTGGRTGDLHSDMLLLLPGTSSSIPSCLERNKIFSPSHPLRSFVREFTLRLGIFLTDEAYGIGREKKNFPRYPPTSIEISITKMFVQPQTQINSIAQLAKTVSSK